MFAPSLALNVTEKVPLDASDLAFGVKVKTPESCDIVTKSLAESEVKL